MPTDLINQTALRWSDPDPQHVPLLREGGITAVLTSPSEAFAAACAQAKIHILTDRDFQTVTLENAAAAKPGVPAIVKAGVWPGVQAPEPGTAGATSSLWIDQNSYLVAYLRALYPNLPPVLGYLPDKDAGIGPDRVLGREVLDLPLVEAWAAGGNFVLALQPSFRESLLRGDANALEAWRRLGRTAAWLREHAALFRGDAVPLVTVLVDRNESSMELASLCFRQNVSPALAPAANPPAPDPQRRPLVAAVGIDAPSADARNRILAAAQAGGTVVVEGPAGKAWWRTSALKPVQSDPDRDFYALGRGRLIAYKARITDPGDVALDLIDFITQKRRTVRIWNCGAGQARAAFLPAGAAIPGKAVLHLVNYSRPAEMPVLARIQGEYSKATALGPDLDPTPVPVARRGSGSEVTLPRVGRAVSVVFS